MSGQDAVPEIILHMLTDGGDDVREIGLQKLPDRAASVHHVLPDHHSEPVTVIIPPGGLDFHVFPDHVEAELLHFPDIEDHGLVRRGRHQALRPVPLIQHTMEEIRGAVQRKAGPSFPVGSCSEGTHPEVSPDLIHSGTQPEMVQERIFRRPEMRGRHRDPELHAGSSVKMDLGSISLTKIRLRILIPMKACRGIFRFVTVRPGTFKPENHLSLNIFRKSQLKLRSLFRRSGRDPDPCDMLSRDYLHPDRLPDAALGVVIHAARLQRLLSPAGMACIRIIPHRHHQFIVPGADMVRDVNAERQVAIPVLSRFFPVPPDDAALIHRAEMKQEAHSRRQGKARDPAPVPQDFPWKQGPLYPGPPGLWGERYQDLSVRRSHFFPRLPDAVVPPSVQAGPVFPHHLRPRVL